MKLSESIPLATRTGREIQNHRDPDLSPANVERTVAKHKKKYPFAELRRPPTGQYNCHGLTFANRRTGIHAPRDVEHILEDDGYRKITLSEVGIGDLAVCYNGDEVSHTGVVVEVREGEGILNLRAARLLSKWGSCGEYFHMATEGPYTEEEITYWTDRL